MNLPGYDNWLEAPYHQAAEESERFLKFCEDYDIDPDDADAENLYNDWLSQWDEPDEDDLEPNYDEYPEEDWTPEWTI